jgi:hypothetical protein
VSNVDSHTHRVAWLARQMFSRAHPIGRDQIFAAFTRVLEALAGVPATRVLVSEVEVAGAEFLGYSAAHLTYRIAAGPLALTCVIDPILASMGVSGEDHTWRGEGLASGFVLRGSAHSSARSPSWAQLELGGVSEARFVELRDAFVAAFPVILSEDELVAELGPRG